MQFQFSGSSILLEFIPFAKRAFLFLSVSILMVTPAVFADSGTVPSTIEVTADNQLDFLDLGQAYGKRQVFCRVSSGEAGTVVVAKTPLKWSSFSRLIAKKKKKRRKAKKAGNQKKFRKLRKAIKKLRSSNTTLSAECLIVIEGLGVKPKPSATPTPNPTPLQTPTPIPTPPVTFSPIRINSGGPSDFLLSPNYSDTKGNVWVSDNYFFGVQSYFHAKDPVSGTSDQEIWMTERYGPAFSYRIPLPDGARYTVVLHIGEIFWTEPGLRVFDVYLEDQAVLENLDLFANFGFNNPNVYVLEVDVFDGTLDIDFYGITQYAKINGIEILRSPADYEPLF